MALVPQPPPKRQINTDALASSLNDKPLTPRKSIGDVGRPSVAHFQRTASAPTRRFDVRGHQAFLQQLRNTLREAREEAIPEGVDPREVQRRIDILVRVIEDTERIGLEARLENEAAHSARYCNTEYQRLSREKLVAQSVEESDKRHTQAYQNQKEDVDMLLRHRHRILSRRTQKCQEVITTNLLGKFLSGEQERKEHDERIQTVLEKRQEMVRQHSQQLKEREERAMAIVSRREAMAEEEYAAKVKQYEEHRAAAEERQRRLEAEKLQAYSAQRKRSAQAMARGASARVSVQLQNAGAPALTVEERPFEVRLQEVEELEKRRLKRLQEEQRMRTEFAKFRAVRNNEKQQVHQQRYNEMISNRLQQHDGYLKDLKKHEERVSNSARRKRDEAELALAKKDRDVAEHLRRAEEVQHERVEGYRRANFTKWSSRADGVAERLLTQYMQLAHEEENRRVSASPPSSKVPSPSSSSHAKVAQTARKSSTLGDDDEGSKHTPPVTPKSSRRVVPSPKPAAVMASLSSNVRHNHIVQALS